MNYGVYKITNKINNRIYIGVHKTENLNDGYMGSGNLIKLAIQKHGLENFNKEWLFLEDSEKDMFLKEKELVTETFIQRKDNYNLTVGGEGGFAHLKGMFRTYDIEGNCFMVTKKDPRYISGELTNELMNIVIVKDGDKNIKISKFDPRYISGELKILHHGTTNVFNQDGDIIRISLEEFKKGNYVSMAKNKALVVDKEGKYHSILTTNKKYLSGDFFHPFQGKLHTDETKKKISMATKITSKGKKNSQYGTIWIKNLELKKAIKIKKKEFKKYKNDGWVKGRKI